ncbi:MAG TPA: Crp/Fnr family transcriptional regulator [Nitrospiraceae bacterium]|nr:Crp/Fnr family transcriptional regulator [Nitrospiraceae bacterium]
MSTVHRLRDTHGQSVRAGKHDLQKAKRTLRESSVCCESLAVCHTGRWTWGPGKGITVLTSPKKQILFSQGEAADAVFYIQAGQVKLTVVSPQGKEAVIAMLERGAFFGESYLAGATVRTKTAIAVEDSTLVRIDKEVMIRLLHEEPAFSELFLTHVLSRNMRIQEDVVDHLFNSSEKRLARVLLLLAHLEKDDRTEAAIPKISQDTLAEMIGTTRARVSFFLNRFRKMGFIDYNSRQHANGELHVRRSLRTIVLDDCRPSYG